MTRQDDRSPPVVAHGWRRVEVERCGRFHDAKLWPGGAKAWKWDETGTRHRPGIQAADVIELLGREPEVVVLSRGRLRRLETRDETLSLLEDRRIEVVREETGKAIDEYNRLAAGGCRVAALLHTTC